MTRIRIPTPLRPYAGGQSEIEAEGKTVGEILQDLTGRFPQLRQHLYGGDGELRAFVNVFLNQDDVRGLQGPATPVAPGDTVMIIPSIAGGNR